MLKAERNVKGGEEDSRGDWFVICHSPVLSDLL
jgi:hypothetical protein